MSELDEMKIRMETEGACINADDPDLFFPERGQNWKTREAKAFCSRCPVLWDCRSWALATRQPYGIWGGLTEVEIDELLGRSVKSRAKPAVKAGA